MKHSEQGLVSASDGLKVTHRASAGRAFETPIVSVDREGLEVTDIPNTMDDVRFVWLEFGVPNEPGKSIKALGEIEPPPSEGLARRVRFKHLFPDQRARLDDLVQRRMASGRVALAPRRVVN